MRHGQIEIDWADGTYSFRLSTEGMEELEEKCGIGSFVILRGLEDRTMRLAHIREVLRIGLIGGGTAPVQALTLVRRYLDSRPVDENRDAALAVMLAGLARVFTLEEFPQGEADAAKPDASTSPRSMEQQA